MQLCHMPTCIYSYSAVARTKGSRAMNSSLCFCLVFVRRTMEKSVKQRQEVTWAVSNWHTCCHLCVVFLRGCFISCETLFNWPTFSRALYIISSLYTCMTQLAMSFYATYNFPWMVSYLCMWVPLAAILP